MAKNASLAELGMSLVGSFEETHDIANENINDHIYPVIDNDKDYFVVRDGVKFAGTHLIIDLWEAENLDDLQITERALTRAAEESGATILHTHLHHFTPNGGISGVVVLAESHISIHTWPERGYAALDIFMCGDCDPHQGIQALKDNFLPKRVGVNEIRRGIVGDGEE